MSEIVIFLLILAQVECGHLTYINLIIKIYLFYNILYMKTREMSLVGV